MQRLQPARPAQVALSTVGRQSQPRRRGPPAPWGLGNGGGAATGRGRLVVQAAEAPKLLPLLATAAAVTATAVAVRHVLVQRQRPQQQGAPAPHRQQRERASGGGGSSGSSSAASWAAALASRQVQGLSLGWPLQSKEAKKERQLLTTLQDIEQRQYREEQAALKHWDARLSLRIKTLGELRAMAKQHNISGRSKMRKRELVAALEARLGFAPQPLQHLRHLH